MTAAQESGAEEFHSLLGQQCSIWPGCNTNLYECEDSITEGQHWHLWEVTVVATLPLCMRAQTPEETARPLHVSTLPWSCSHWWLKPSLNHLVVSKPMSPLPENPAAAASKHFQDHTDSHRLLSLLFTPRSGPGPGWAWFRVIVSSVLFCPWTLFLRRGPPLPPFYPSPLPVWFLFWARRALLFLVYPRAPTAE